MRVLLVGVSCVGKTTLGRLLGHRLGSSFFDLDTAVEEHFGTSIERLQARFLTDYSYRKECSVVLTRIATDHPECVIALPPSGLRHPYLRVIRKLSCVTVVVEDTAENILDRVVLYDIDSKIIDKRLTGAEKRLHLREIEKDIRFFEKSYQAADLHADIAGLDAEAGARRIEALLAAHVHGLAPPPRAGA